MAVTLRRSAWKARFARCLLLGLSLPACGQHEDAADFLLPPPRDGGLRLVSWNIEGGRGSSLDAVASRLLRLDADVILLQEVDRNVPRSGSVDQAAQLARILGYNFAFAAAIPLDGGDYGIATLSRFSLEEVAQLTLSNDGAGEARTALEVLTCVEERCLHIVNHHADRQESAATRSVQEILDVISLDIGRGLVLAGDLNQQSWEPGPLACSSSGLHDLVAEHQEAPSFKRERIDYIFADSSLAPCVRRAGVVLTSESDHRAVLADLSLPDCD